MPSLVRKLSLQTVAIAVATAIVFVSAKIWPQYQLAIWGLFLAAVGLVIYAQLKEPVNYKSLRVSEKEIEYVPLSNDRTVISLNAIVRVEFVREQALFEDLYGPYLETKWVIGVASGARIEIMDEWPHRRQLINRFDSALAGFDAATAKKAIRAKKEGKWLCFGARTP
jgi:hypothetical protein